MKDGVGRLLARYPSPHAPWTFDWQVKMAAIGGIATTKQLHAWRVDDILIRLHVVDVAAARRQALACRACPPL
ncbi:hypothetical protein GCM10009775_27400 [Microbacterium aoyamense]|uniref:Uncharacterized protein n=1 Tax=Microbacterium aoyamense TaxID=344166 RepID=A0ABN2PWC5_9MICO